MTTNAARVALLEEWMKGKEGENLEFKKAENRYSFTELCKYCSALANEGGGRVILGVTNDRPRKVVGSSAFEQLERTRKSICEQIPLAIDFDVITHPDGRRSFWPPKFVRWRFRMTIAPRRSRIKNGRTG